MMRELPLKKILFWCPRCNVPLVGKKCGCGGEGKGIPLLRPYDARPALQADRDTITGLLVHHFGTATLPRVVILNKTGGLDRKDLVIANGERFGWLSFDPFARRHHLEVALGAVPFLLGSAEKGVIDVGDLNGARQDLRQGKRIGGKRYPCRGDLPDGPVIIRWEGHAAVGTCREGFIKVREAGKAVPVSFPDPNWEEVIRKNAHSLRNMERTAIRFIRQNTRDRRCVTVSFSGGKDSTAARELARRAGFSDVFFVDTGMEFPETLAFIRSQEVGTVLRGKDFWQEIGRKGPPRKDDRWCCERQKLEPVKKFLAGKGECITIQGNRWYESFARSSLAPVAKNPFYPLQVNLSPILNWRAFEVFLYIWWRGLSTNPLYDKGFERVGCWMCPAMLESEWERVRELHPELHGVWMDFLQEWGKRKGISPDALAAGAWRWKDIPPKMRAGK
ncbi:MAG: phosphoadenosine phosphosulfate reductase family protein [Methanolinea sp.]|nr:phosphoadenosine phosphosulfate reductase family protein [Methanolinea sp.]